MHCFLWLSLLVTIVAADCPNLNLDWGTYEGALQSNGVCKYSNVRFATPPLGDLRFAAPQYPPKSALPIPGLYPGCVAMTETPCSPGAPANAKNCYPEAQSGTGVEDCLFLDIYVPEAARKSQAKVPTVVWFYGGSYVFGSKTQYDFSVLPLYDGNGIVGEGWNAQSAIFVAGNYRLGAFGWLAGSYMEKNAQPNVGLLDQRAIIQFVSDNIGLLNGDANQISVWGESAGASSILHHLIMDQSKYPALFKRAVVQSPAYQWQWNRTGVLNATFTSFATQVKALAGCSVADLKCLRGASSDVLRKVNQALFNEVSCFGIQPVGPAVDGDMIKDIPSNLFSDPTKVAKLDTIIVSHVNLEVPYSNNRTSFSFLPLPIRQNPTDPAKFDAFLNDFLTGSVYAATRRNISLTYSLTNNPQKKTYKDQIERAQHVIMDSSFLCNTRVLLDAYMVQKRPVYAMNYDFLGDFHAATHASDLIPTFVTNTSDYSAFFDCLADIDVGGGVVSDYVKEYLGPGMQGYFLAHAINGNPNRGSNGPATKVTWNSAGVDYSRPSNGRISNVMQPGYNIFTSPFSDNNIIDDQNTDAVCGYWKLVAANITKAYNSVKSGETEPRAGFHEGQTVLEMEL